MRLSRVIPAIMAMIALAACQAPGELADPTLATLAAAPPPPAPEALPANRVLLKAATPEAAAQAVAESRGRVVETLPWLGVQVIELPEPAAEAMARRLGRLPGVLYAEPDVVVRLTAPPSDKGPKKDRNEPTPEPTPEVVPCGEANDPNDPRYNGGGQWGLVQIAAERAWDAGHRSDAGVRIAILDTGIDRDHEDLKGVVFEKNFTRSRTTDDHFGHGTHVAGIAAGTTSNCLGIAGAGYHASLINLKVLNDDGSGYHSWIAAGLHEAAQRGVEIINMSLSSSVGSQTLESAVAEAHAAGVLLLAAAGNSGGDEPEYPARYAEVVAVAATDPSDRRASFSNQGAELAAPGVEILSTLPNHDNRIGVMDYGSLNGTSMATPFVAGAAAVLWQLEAAGGDGVAERVRSRLAASGTGGAATGSRFGRIDLGQAVN